jgi:hypothetical protein
MTYAAKIGTFASIVDGNPGDTIGFSPTYNVGSITITTV